MKRLRFLGLHRHILFVIMGVVILFLIINIIVFMATQFRPTIMVKVGSGVYNVWVADDEGERIKGLSGADTLAANGGLLLDFKSSANHGIWMKDMLQPIDIIWLNENKTIVYVVKNAQPETGTDVIYQPTDPARYVLELPAGSIQSSAIKTGGKAEFTLEGGS